LVANATPFIDAGLALSELHLGYELGKLYPLDGLPDPESDGPFDPSDAAFQHFRVEKMRFGRPTTEQKLAELTKDRSTIVYNDHITLRGVPEDAYSYMLGSRSAIEWIMERYQVKVDKASQIRNDPNDWSREVGNPRYILDLLSRIVTVSLETMRIVDALPAMEVLMTQEND
jgi:predicted helicase